MKTAVEYNVGSDGVRIVELSDCWIIEKIETFRTWTRLTTVDRLHWIQYSLIRLTSDCGVFRESLDKYMVSTNRALTCGALFYVPHTHAHNGLLHFKNRQSRPQSPHSLRPAVEKRGTLGKSNVDHSILVIRFTAQAQASLTRC